MEQAQLEAGVNLTPLTPISFLDRAASVHPDATSIIYGQQRSTWSLTLQRCKRLATALRLQGIAEGDTVSVLAPNVPEMCEAHFGVPMSGAVLNALNTRLDAKNIGSMLTHSQARVLLVHSDLLTLAIDSLRHIMRQASSSTAPAGVAKGLTWLSTLVIIKDALSRADPVEMKQLVASVLPQSVSILSYDELLITGDPDAPMRLFMPTNENAPIALNYTSGTTSAPKGVLYSHRGAFLNAMSALLMAGLPQRPVYLWTLPMFHCNGWCFPWAVAALTGVNVCLRQLDIAEVFRCIVEHRVDLLCGAPTVLTMMLGADDSTRDLYLQRRRDTPVKVLTGGAPPPAAVLGKMESLGFKVLHTYGLTETYGPGTICEWKSPEWDNLSLHERARLNSRQGVRHLGLESVAVMDSDTMAEVPRDGETMGEVMFRGNTVMQGYLRNAEATETAFRGGWYHSGDLAVVHPDGYIQIKDRSKDIIISGGENISSIQVEGVLYQYPDVLEAAVTAMPDEKWGETPCAFVTLKREGVESGGEGEFHTDHDLEGSIKSFCRANLPRFMAPTRVVFGPLPKTSTGKIQKFKLREVAKALAGERSVGLPMRSRL